MEKKITPKFKIGDVIIWKDSKYKEEQIITGIRNDEKYQLYSVNGTNKMIEACFPIEWQDDAELVGHKSLVIGDKVYE